MKKVSLSEYFELESVEFQDQCIVGGRSRYSHSWFRYYHDILSFCRGRRRLVLLTIAFVTFVVLVANNAASLKHDEETPTAYNALHLFEKGRYPKNACNFQCCGARWPQDPASKPFERRVDRSYCEDDFDKQGWDGLLEDLRNSEILRCYNITFRYCVLDNDTDVPDNAEDKQKYVSNDCAYEFFEHDGLLYSISGSLMPESFNAKCEDFLQWKYVHYLTPENGCGDDVPLRFCHCNGTIDFHFVNGDGPFNCNEFKIADTLKMGSMDDDGLEWYCERERQKRCP